MKARGAYGHREWIPTMCQRSRWSHGNYFASCCESRNFCSPCTKWQKDFRTVNCKLSSALPSAKAFLDRENSSNNKTRSEKLQYEKKWKHLLTNHKPNKTNRIVRRHKRCVPVSVRRICFCFCFLFLSAICVWQSSRTLYTHAQRWQVVHRDNMKCNEPIKWSVSAIFSVHYFVYEFWNYRLIVYWLLRIKEWREMHMHTRRLWQVINYWTKWNAAKSKICCNSVRVLWRRICALIASHKIRRQNWFIVFVYG